MFNINWERVTLSPTSPSKSYFASGSFFFFGILPAVLFQMTGWGMQTAPEPRAVWVWPRSSSWAPHLWLNVFIRTFNAFHFGRAKSLIFFNFVLGFFSILLWLFCKISDFKGIDFETLKYSVWVNSENWVHIEYFKNTGCLLDFAALQRCSPVGTPAL